MSEMAEIQNRMNDLENANNQFRNNYRFATGSSGMIGKGFLDLQTKISDLEQRISLLEEKRNKKNKEEIDK
jgi:BMFP domain-containing protein YqiC